MSLPVSAPSITACVGHQLAPFGARRGRMPKLPPSGQGWPVGGTRRRREAQGTGPSRLFFCDGPAQRSGRPFLVTFCGCRQKVTRLQGETQGSAAGKAQAARKRTPQDFRKKRGGQ